MKQTSLALSASRLLTGAAAGLVLAALCIAILWPRPANAGGYLYSGKRKAVNCGVLVLGPATKGMWNQPLNASFDAIPGVGDLFNLLDYRVDLKPAGWSLDNPYAPVDDQGRKFDKSDPRFWQVKLDTARNLTRMHVLYLPASGNVVLDVQDREKLRRFVDSGGVLWIDNVDPNNPLTFTAFGSPTTDPGSFFIPSLYFTGSGAGYDIPWSRHHPLLTMPYWLDDREVMMIGSNWGAAACHPGYDVGGDAGLSTSPPLTSDVLYPIVAKNNGMYPSVVANSYGSGRVVATANFAGGGCFIPYPNNLPSLKLAYNILAWSSSWTDLRKDPRRSGRSIDTVGGSSLVKMWSLPDAPPSGESGAIIYKNVAYYSSGSTLYAMDVMPMEDLDNNGNPDDGVQDMWASNTGVDRVWSWPCADGSPISSPTIVTIQDPKNANGTVEVVLVMSEAGTVYMLDAFPHDARGVLGTGTSVLASWPTEPTDHPNPPICVNGWVYSASGSGRLYACNPALEQWKTTNPDPDNKIPSRWIVPDPIITTYSTLKSGPLFGYVTASNTGAVTGMVYWCVSAPYDPLATATVREQNDYIYGVPVCVRNDRLKLRQANNTRTICEYATSYPDLRMTEDNPKPVPRVTCSDAAFNYTAIHPNSGLSGGTIVNKYGSLVLEFNKEVPADLIVYADYSINYANATNEVVRVYMPRIRAALTPSSLSGGGITPLVPKTEVAAMPALGSDNILFVTGKREQPSSYGSGGSIYAIKNDGSSAQSTKWNYMLHSGVLPGSDLLAGLTTTPMPIPGLLVRKPTSVDQIDSLAIPAPQPYSSPVVWGDKVFVTVSSSKGIGGALLCLKASSDFVIRIMENTGVDESGKPIRHPKKLWDLTTGRGLQVKIWQPNLMCGPSGLGVSMEAVPVPGNMLDRDKGTITFTSFDRLKLKGGTLVMQETNAFSPSLPVWVLIDEMEIPIDWNTWGPTSALADQLTGTMPQITSDCVDLSGWNNLLWYYVPPNCSGIHSSPVLIGNCVYFVTDDGMLYAVDCETGETRGAPMDAYYEKPGGWSPDPKFVYWKEPVESSGNNTPTPMPTTDVHVSPSGSNGVLLVPGPTSLCAYANPTTLVADTNRLVEVDSSGNVTWSLDSVQVPVAVPASGNPSGTQSLPRRKIPINKPSRARYMETGEIMLVNTGANMVCKTDKAGNVGVQMVKTLSDTAGWVKMAFDRFEDPKKLLRPGQSKTLSGPSDAVSWMEYEPGANNNQIMAMHCVIADSGNSRVLDLVFRFNRLGQLMNTAREDEYGYYLPELNWVSNTESKGEKYVFDSVQIVPESAKDQSIWAAISNYRSDPTVPNPQGLGGAIVQLKYRTRTDVDQPWDYSATDSGRIMKGCDKFDAGGPTPELLACPRFFQVLNEPTGRFLLICDNHGVYKIGPLGGVPPVVQSLTDDAYRNNIDRDSVALGLQAITAPLLASSAQQLPNGKWLIANSYSGMVTLNQGLPEERSEKFQGEVFEYDPANNQITWSSPQMKVKTDLNGRVLGFEQVMGTSYNLQQPRSAFRQF